MAMTQKEKIAEVSERIRQMLNKSVRTLDDNIELLTLMEGYQDCKETVEVKGVYGWKLYHDDNYGLLSERSNSFDPHLAYPELFEFVDQTNKELEKDKEEIEAMFDILERLLRGEKIDI